MPDLLPRAGNQNPRKTAASDRQRECFFRFQHRRRQNQYKTSHRGQVSGTRGRHCISIYGSNTTRWLYGQSKPPKRRHYKGKIPIGDFGEIRLLFGKEQIRRFERIGKKN